VSGCNATACRVRARDGIRVRAVTDPHFYPVDRDSFGQIRGAVAQVLDLDCRLPDWPFTVPVGNADVCQFDLAIAGTFGPVLQRLVDAHGDTSVSLVVLEPTPDYYRENYGSYPAFTIPGQNIAETYWGVVAYEPDDDPTGAVIFTADVVGIVGSSARWAVWAERSWDIAIVLSQHVGGAWLSAPDLNFAPVDIALEDYTEPDFKIPLTDEARSTFLHNVRTRGTLM
jgi:hypothetical protein